MSFKPNSFVGKWLLPSSYSFDTKASMAFYLFSSRLACGDEGVRTPDLVVANHALSQLSYIPSRKDEIRRMKDESNASVLFCFILHNSSFSLSAVGVLGFEPRTSALSELRSSQLSYTPWSNRGWTNKKAKPKRFGSTRAGIWDRASTLHTDQPNDETHEFHLTGSPV